MRLQHVWPCVTAQKGSASFAAFSAVGVRAAPMAKVIPLTVGRPVASISRSQIIDPSSFQIELG